MAASPERIMTPMSMNRARQSSGAVAARDAVSLQDCIGMINDILSIFQGDDDAQSVDAVRRKAEEFCAEAQQEQESLRKIASKLEESVSTTEDKLNAQMGLQTHHKDIEALESRKKEILDDIMQLEDECQSKETELEQLRSESTRIRAALARVQTEQKKEVPRRGAVRSMFAVISHARFLKTPGKAGTVSGYTIWEGQKIREFEYGAEPSYEQTSDLWDLIDP